MNIVVKQEIPFSDFIKQTILNSTNPVMARLIIDKSTFNDQTNEYIFKLPSGNTEWTLVTYKVLMQLLDVTGKHGRIMHEVTMSESENYSPLPVAIFTFYSNAPSPIEIKDDKYEHIST